LFALFFVISGAELDLSVFTKGMMVLVGVIYIASRSIGKYTGAWSSAKLAKSDTNIVKYLGITLLPQAGVALGMADLVQEATEFSAILVGGMSVAQIVLNITLFAVLIYELFGPMATRAALTAAGDIVPKSEDVKNRRQRKLALADLYHPHLHRHQIHFHLHHFHQQEKKHN
jgi:Kef-type K+ transport system membrane component KefB